MDNIFSFKRIGLMLQADWLAYQKRLSFILGIVFLVFLCMIVSTNLETQNQFFLFSLLLASMAYCNNFVEPKLHNFTQQFLTLPTYNFEKYIEILIVGVIHVIVYGLIYILGLYLNHILLGKEVVTVAQILVYVGSLYGLLFFLWHYVFIMYVFFSRFGLQAAILSLSAISGIVYFVGIRLPETIIKPIMAFSLNHYNPILFVLGIGLLCVAYWKIKIKQIR
jgi:hypothetical protein